MDPMIQAIERVAMMIQYGASAESVRDALLRDGWDEGQAFLFWVAARCLGDTV